MQIRIKEMKLEIQSHEEATRKYKEKQRLHDETISCAARTWDQVWAAHPITLLASVWTKSHNTFFIHYSMFSFLGVLTKIALNCQ